MPSQTFGKTTITTDVDGISIRRGDNAPEEFMLTTGNIQSELGNAGISLGIPSVPDFTALSSAAVSPSIQVNDINRGGIFIYKTNGYTVDNIVTFAAPGGFWVRQYTGRMQVSWAGVLPGSADNTLALDTLLLLASTRKENVEFGSGTYNLRYINLYKNVSLFGQGSSNTFFQSLTSSEANFIRLADAPILRVQYRGFKLLPTSTNPAQNGIGLVAIPQLIPNYTGGLWWAELEDIEVNGFGGHQLYAEAYDGTGTSSDGRGDLANQWLTFTNVRLFRANSNTSRCLKVIAQFGQVTFITCQFDGPVNGVPNTVNIEIDTVSTPSSTDYAYVVDFYNCTIQNSDYGFLVNKAQHISITNSYFENLSKSITATGGSTVLVSGSRFANAGDGTKAGNTAGTGYLFAPNASFIDVRDYWKIGVVDKDFAGTNPTGYSIPVVKAASTTTLFTSTGIVPNRGVDASGIITTNFLHEVLVNTNTTRTLVAINSQLSTGDRVMLRIFDSSTSAQSIADQTRALNYIIISNSGAALNLQLPAWSGGTIVLRHGDTITFQKSDINGQPWVVADLTRIERVKSAIPTAGLYVLGEKIYNSSPVAGGYTGWICTQTGGSISSAWTSGQPYTAFTYVSNSGKVYRLVTAGGSTATVPPTHTTGSVTGADGYVWNFESSTFAIFKGFGLIEA